MVRRSILSLALFVAAAGLAVVAAADEQPFALTVSIELLLGETDDVQLEIFGQEYLFAFNECASFTTGIKLNSIQFHAATVDDEAVDEEDLIPAAIVDATTRVTRPATILGSCMGCADEESGNLKNPAVLLPVFARPCGDDSSVKHPRLGISKLVTTFPSRKAMNTIAKTQQVDRDEVEQKLLRRGDERAKNIVQAVQEALSDGLTNVLSDGATIPDKKAPLSN